MLTLVRRNCYQYLPLLSFGESSNKYWLSSARLCAGGKDQDYKHEEANALKELAVRLGRQMAKQTNEVQCNEYHNRDMSQML